MDLVHLVAVTDSQEDLSHVISNYLVPLPWDQAFVKIINLLEKSLLIDTQVQTAASTTWEYLLLHHLWDTSYHTLPDFEQNYPHTQEIKETVLRETQTQA